MVSRLCNSVSDHKMSAPPSDEEFQEPTFEVPIKTPHKHKIRKKTLLNKRQKSQKTKSEKKKVISFSNPLLNSSVMELPVAPK